MREMPLDNTSARLLIPCRCGSRDGRLCFCDDKLGMDDQPEIVYNKGAAFKGPIQNILRYL